MKDKTKRIIRRVIFSLIFLFAIISLFIWLSFHTLKLRIAQYKFSKKVFEQEEINKVSVDFRYLPSGWTHILKQPMNNIWQPLDIEGMNYFVFGQPRSIFSNYSERSNPYSKYYQAWFGVYVIKGCVKWLDKENENIDVSGLAQIAELDQKAWLQKMGMENPKAVFTQVDSTKTICVGEIERVLIEAAIESNSDITGKSNQLIDLIGMPDLKSMQGVEAYHKLTLNGYFCPWYDSEKDVTVLIYACGSKFTTKNGEKFEYFTEIKPEILKMIKGVKLIPIS